MVYYAAGITLVLSGMVLVRCAATSARRAERSYPPTGAFVTVEGCRLHYVRQGEGPAVVFLHGSDGFWQDFAGVLQARPAPPGERIAFDRPGHGYSESPDRNGGQLPTQALLLRTALQKLGVVRPILVGHSWSAALCLLYALEYPEDVAGLVLVSPWACPGVDPPPLLLHAAAWIGRYGAFLLLAVPPIKRLLLRRMLKRAFYPDDVPPAYEQEALALWQRTPGQVGVFLQENRDAWARLPALARRYTQITAPVTLLFGERDATVHADRQAQTLQRLLPVSKLFTHPQAGHEIPHLHPDLVWQAVDGCREMAAAAEAAASAAAAPAEAPPEQRARELVFRYGWNATAYQILNPNILYWFSPDGEAVVGYVRHFKTRVAAGAPICDEERLAEIALRFEEEAAQHGERVCWFAATTRLLEALAGTEHAPFAIGAQPIWNPSHWPNIVRKNASLRAQLNRAANKGVTVSEWPEERAAGDPGLQRCLEEWLAQHALPTLRFLTEPVTLDRLKDRRLFVAEVGGTPVGFLIATPVPSRNGWLVEQIVRGRKAPNGTAERLVDTTMRALAADGYAYLTLGLVPLTPRAPTAISPPRLWLRALLTWARLHGRRFYNFEGLDAFKAKFKPETWEPLLALSNEPRVSLRTLMAIAAAFSDAPLLWTAARILTKAARQEARWLMRKGMTR